MKSDIYMTKVGNDRAEALTMWLEPWGEDYTLLPGETFDVVAEGTSTDFYFQVSCNEKDVLVWAEGECAAVFVRRDGESLECGHNRQRSVTFPNDDAP